MDKLLLSKCGLTLDTGINSAHYFTIYSRLRVIRESKLRSLYMRVNIIKKVLIKQTYSLLLHISLQEK